jgi:nucleotide-diphospho-sugar transferase
MMQQREPEVAVTIDQIRAVASKKFTWNEYLEREIVAPLENLESLIDVSELSKLVALVEKNGVVAVTFASEEYIGVCENWLVAMQKLALNNHIVIAGDSTTQELLERIGVPHIAVSFRTRWQNNLYRNPVGFTQKGLAMTALKFPIVRAILRSGYSVIMSDLDAVWLRDPQPFLEDCDLAFQRVVYFPAVIARLWGFCACSGFVYFRNCPGTLSFVDECVRQHKLISDDQWALNLALLEANVLWEHQATDWNNSSTRVTAYSEAVIASFRDSANVTIEGRLDWNDLRVRALAHHTFWRHPFVSYEPSRVVVCHATSSKNNQDKLTSLKSMGALMIAEITESKNTTTNPE